MVKKIRVKKIKKIMWDLPNTPFATDHRCHSDLAAAAVLVPSPPRVGALPRGDQHRSHLHRRGGGGVHTGRGV